jgi:hypothetical protein
MLRPIPAAESWPIHLDEKEANVFSWVFWMSLQLDRRALLVGSDDDFKRRQTTTTNLCIPMEAWARSHTGDHAAACSSMSKCGAW